METKFVFYIRIRDEYEFKISALIKKCSYINYNITT